MKASDFTTSSGEREEVLGHLLLTEKTDAVNSGLVEKADKSERALKGDLYSVGKKGTRGAKSAALDSIAAKGPHNSAADDARTAEAMTKGRARTWGAPFGTASRRARGGAADSSPSRLQSEYNLKKRLRKTAGLAASSRATHKALEGSELDGADDLVYKGHGAYRLAVRAQSRLRRKGSSRSGKDPLAKDGKGSLGALSEKRYRAEATDLKSSARKSQFASYYRRTVYEVAAEAPVKEKAATLLFGGTKGLFLSFTGLLGQVLPAIVSAILIVSILAGIFGAADEASKKSASLDGMPAWVTYDLVLACLTAHEQYGYPASALLGQMMIENGTSDSGSELGRLYHNYGGVKYAGYDYGGLITGSVRYLTTEYTSGGSAYKIYADFAVFKDDNAYMTYRCEHLYKQRNYTRVPNYQKAIAENNSELFLRALGEGGYYTTSPDSYVAMYRSICSQYPLVAQLDSMTSEQFRNSFSGGALYPGGGQDYASAQGWQKNIVNCCYGVGWPGAALCATWTSRVYAAAGYRVGGNGNSQLGDQGGQASYYPSRATTDLSQIQVGMLISAQYGSNSYAGNRYGHVGIYVGDGNVMESTSYGVMTTPLSTWVSRNNRGWVVCGYPWDWR